ncbi:MAG: hypothetical protein QOE70_996 [Chthoniobacter sp.]|nr:hypothetical protein [Chthoniobacter sp.]
MFLGLFKNAQWENDICVHDFRSGLVVPSIKGSGVEYGIDLVQFKWLGQFTCL